MKVGVALADITPAVGVELSGGAFGPSRAVLHPLLAKALLLEEDSSRLLLVACDLLGFDWDYSAAIRDEIARTHGIAFDAIMLTGTHTHCGPATVTLRNWGARDEDYRRKLRAALVALAGRAAGALRPGRIGAATTSCPGVSVNRSLKEAGTTNDTLAVARVDYDDGRPAAVIVNYGCHPVNLHSSGMITPDYPHFVEADIHKGLGEPVPVLFLLGTCGDLNPANFDAERTEARAAETGGKIARKALDVLSGLTTASPGPLARATCEVEVGLQPLPAKEELLEIIGDRGRKMAEAADKSPANWQYCGHKTAVEWARDALRAIESGRIETSRRIPLQAFGIGEMAVLGVPGELFAEFGVAIQRAIPARHVFVATLANGCMGYFPPPLAYERKTYEAVSCPRFLGLYCYQPDVGERVCRASLELLGQLG